MTRRMLAMAACAALMVLTAAANDKPNYSGKWKLNASKSDLGQMPAPEKWETAIEHNEPAMKVTTVMVTQMGERTVSYDYKTDGSEVTMKDQRGEGKATMKWDGNALVLNAKRKVNFQGNEMEITTEERWTLSEDKKSLTMEGSMKTSEWDAAYKRVLDRMD